MTSFEVPKDGVTHFGFRFRYLHQNAISKMENLSNLKNLVALNLSHNHIKVIEGLEGLDNLKNLDLSHNYISEMSNCSQVKQLPALASLDISHN